MEDNLEEYVLYKETMNGTNSAIIRDVLEANDIRFKYIQRVVGFKYKTIYNQIYIHNEDMDKAVECLNDGVFSDMPWDPDSDDLSPEPDFPWYLDEKKREKVGNIACRIVLLVVVIAVALAFYQACN